MTILPPSLLRARDLRARLAFYAPKEHKPLMRYRPNEHSKVIGAGNEARTRDLNLGKVALYQLSYSRTGKGGILSRLIRKSRQRTVSFYIAIVR